MGGKTENRKREEYKRERRKYHFLCVPLTAAAAAAAAVRCGLTGVPSNPSPAATRGFALLRGLGLPFSSAAAAATVAVASESSRLMVESRVLLLLDPAPLNATGLPSLRLGVSLSSTLLASKPSALSPSPSPPTGPALVPAPGPAPAPATRARRCRSSVFSEAYSASFRRARRSRRLHVSKSAVTGAVGGAWLLLLPRLLLLPVPAPAPVPLLLRSTEICAEEMSASTWCRARSSEESSSNSECASRWCADDVRRCVMSAWACVRAARRVEGEAVAMDDGDSGEKAVGSGDVGVSGVGRVGGAAGGAVAVAGSEGEAEGGRALSEEAADEEDVAPKGVGQEGDFLKDVRGTADGERYEEEGFCECARGVRSCAPAASTAAMAGGVGVRGIMAARRSCGPERGSDIVIRV